MTFSSPHISAILHRLTRIAILLAVVLAFAACSSGGDSTTGVDEPEVPSTPQKAVVFGSVLNAAQQQTTRASNLEDKGITSFKVFGYTNTAYDATQGYLSPRIIYPGYTVKYTAGTSDTNSSNWEYVGLTGFDTQVIHYWDYLANAYRFAAYAPADAAGVTTTLATDRSTLTLTLPADAASSSPVYYSKLWFSNNTYATDMPAYGDVVTMQFVPPLARVRFKFVDGAFNDIVYPHRYLPNIVASSISFKPTDTSKSTATKGTVTVTYPLTGTATAETFTAVGDGTAVTITEPYEESAGLTTGTKKWYTVLPVGAQGSYTLTVEYNHAVRTAVVDAQYLNWQPGYEYTYVFSIDDVNVQFAPNLSVYTKWQAGYAQTTTW
jgi:hypothetical protein